ncbi:BamA/TamA family outer membrane protein, partial [Photobacterium damselae]
MANSPYLYATENEPQQDWIDNFLTQLGSSDTIDVSQGIDWGVLPGPFANPEQGVGFGIAAVGLYAPSDWVETTPYSTLAIKSYISSTGSYGLG